MKRRRRRFSASCRHTRPSPSGLCALTPPTGSRALRATALVDLADPSARCRALALVTALALFLAPPQCSAGEIVGCCVERGAPHPHDPAGISHPHSRGSPLALWACIGLGCPEYPEWLARNRKRRTRPRCGSVLTPKAMQPLGTPTGIARHTATHGIPHDTVTPTDRHGYPGRHGIAAREGERGFGSGWLAGVATHHKATGATTSRCLSCRPTCPKYVALPCSYVVQQPPMPHRTQQCPAAMVRTRRVARPPAAAHAAHGFPTAGRCACAWAIGPSRSCSRERSAARDVLVEACTFEQRTMPAGRCLSRVRCSCGR